MTSHINHPKQRLAQDSGTAVAAPAVTTGVTAFVPRVVAQSTAAKSNADFRKMLLEKK